MKNNKKCKFTAGLDSIPLEKAHLAIYWRKNRSIKSYISLNSAGSNKFWWNGKGIAYHYIRWFVKIKPDCMSLSYLKRKFCHLRYFPRLYIWYARWTPKYYEDSTWNPALYGRGQDSNPPKADFAHAQPAAYGFEGMASEFPNLLKLKQHIEIIKLKISIFLLILHVLADFGKIFSHEFSHNYNGLPCVLITKMKHF
jgi:hypothetical protein